MPALIWDNIPNGQKISCPHIERSCTTAWYSDRRLGVSETVATSAATIHFFTGNNVGPRGDLTSRSLQTRIVVDRPDPENRTFDHPDPIGWTESNRGKILRALYTVLLGNPLFHGKRKPAQTRFKIWWSLVGQAVEAAAEQHKKGVDDAKMKPITKCPPSQISFKKLFLAQEDENEDSLDLADALTVLAGRTRNSKPPTSPPPLTRPESGPQTPRASAPLFCAISSIPNCPNIKPSPPRAPVNVSSAISTSPSRITVRSWSSKPEPTPTPNCCSSMSTSPRAQLEHIIQNTAGYFGVPL